MKINVVHKVRHAVRKSLSRLLRLRALGSEVARRAASPTSDIGPAARARAVRGTDAVFVPVAPDVDLSLDPATDRTHAAVDPWLTNVMVADEREVDDDARAEFVPPTDLPAAMAAELDGAQGFQIEHVERDPAGWDLRRGGEDYDASYDHVDPEQLGRARDDDDSGERAGENWFEQLTVAAHEPRN